MKKINCIAIDDEPLALLVITRFCERKGGMDLETYSEPSIGLKEIIRRKPDIVFLDIEMNSISGLEIAHSLPRETCLIFTTAHAQYALNGFDLDAVDFLHKPFAYDRFEKAVDKALRRIESRYPSEPNKIVIKQEYNNITVFTSEILYIEAMGNYTKIFRTSGGYILSHTNMKTIQDMLPEESFLRIHRSYIIALEKVEMFSKRRIKLKGKEAPLPVGQQFAGNVYDVLTRKDLGICMKGEN